MSWFWKDDTITGDLGPIFCMVKVVTRLMEVRTGFNFWWCGSDSVYGGAGEDILIDLEGGDVIYGDDGAGSRFDDSFVVGGGTTIQDFDLSPDGTDYQEEAIVQ